MNPGNYPVYEDIVALTGRPIRETIIERDEIVSLIIDCEVLNERNFFDKYFNLAR